MYHTSSYASGAGLPAFIPGGTVIGAGGNGNVGYALFQHSIPAIVFTTDQTGNIAFQTTAGNWGYANVSWREATATLTINSAFVESVSGQPITVVGVPEPTVAGLLALGAVGAARRRRRQLAAA